MAQWTFDHKGAPIDAPRQGPVYIALGDGDAVCGVLVVEPAEGVPLMLEQQTLLGALSGQIALALERARLAELAAAARAAAERSALRNTLLASISHDLRGPLAAIAGAGSLVAQGSGALDRRRHMTLGSLIEEKARDMSVLLSNVLELVRLETAAAPPPAADWQSLEELVATAVRSNEHRLSRWLLTTAVPADFPPLWVDAQLIVQLLSNLLENEVKYTPPGTRIGLQAVLVDQQAVLSVEDDGPGFGDRDPETLFEKFERGQPEGHISGVGLGLAICRAIAHLHGGEIRAMNRLTGGARFVITLPLSFAPEVEDSRRVS
jgi:two-component system sensor histidine kinase KdpD